jgi:hypothetical protein
VTQRIFTVFLAALACKTERGHGPDITKTMIEVGFSKAIAIH